MNLKKIFKEKNKTTNEINSLMNNSKDILNCENNKSSKIKEKNSDEIKQQNKNIDKGKKMNSDNDKIIGKSIQFEKDEIKQDLNIKKANFFEIENIKITNIGNGKEFKNLYMVIDTNTSSQHLLFFNNSWNCTYQKLTLDGPLLKGESLNNIITLYIKEPKISEYTIFAYIREKRDGDNLSLPFKITINVYEDPEEIKRKEEKEKENKKICHKGVDKIKIEEMINSLENEYNIFSMFDEEEIVIKIIEFNCDKQKINEWIMENL